MFRRFVPLLAIFLSILIDTAIFPVIYNGVFVVPLSLAVVILISIQLGRTRGMLYGLFGGLLLDITSGYLGLKLFAYVVIGYLIGFLLDSQSSEERINHSNFQLFRAHFVWIFVLYFTFELVMLVYQYFSTAVFEWIYVRNLLLRDLIFTVLTLALYPLCSVLFLGGNKHKKGKGKVREVKNY